MATAAIAAVLVVAAPSAFADAGDIPIVGTTTGNLVTNLNSPPGCTGTVGANPCSVTVYVRGEWQWLTHNSDCNTDRAGEGVGLVWIDPNEPGYTVTNGHGITVGVGVSKMLNGDTYNTLDEMVHPADLGDTPENLPGIASQAFNDPFPPNPTSFASWKGGCGREPLTQTAGIGAGTSTGCGETPPSTDCMNHPWGSWGYAKSNVGSDGKTYFGYAHTYVKRSDVSKVCVSVYDVHGGGNPGSKTFQQPKSATEVKVDGNNDNSIKDNDFEVFGGSCLFFPQVSTSATTTTQLGNQFTDTATISGVNPGAAGHVRFQAWKSPTCSGTPDLDTGSPGAAVSGVGGSVLTATASLTPASAGDYHWIATYGGDPLFITPSVSGVCGDPGELSHVTSTNRPPMAVNDSAATSQGVPVTINVLANDSDPDGDPLTVTVLTPPGNGSVVVNPDKTITYTPGPGFTGTDSFVYQICDPSAACASAPVSVLVPTAVAFEGGAAFLRPDGAHVAWHTGFEVGNLGFDVYRRDRGSRVKLTRTPMAGSALVVGPTAPVSGDRSYGFVDPEGRSGSRYWVRDLDVNGRSTWRGPYAVRATAPSWAATARPAAPLGDLGRTGGSSSAPRVAHVGSAGPGDSPVGAGPSVRSPAVKIMVDDEGWYRVPLATLAGLGVDTRNPSRLRVWAEGKEQVVETSADALEFYGLGLDTPATGTRVYWVSAGGSAGARVPVVDGSAEGPAAGDSFTATVTRRDRIVYFASLLNGEADNFFGGLVFPVPTTETLDVPELFTADGAQLEVSVQGVTAGHHSVQVDLNGVALGSLSFDGQALGDATFPAPGLVDGSNDVTLTSGSAGDYGLVGTISATYQRRYAATGDALRFTVGGGTRVAVTGFSDPAVRLVDATDAAAPVEVTPVISAEGRTYTATATIPGTGTRTLYAFASGRVDAPGSVVADRPSSLRSPGNAADLVVITTADLAPSVAPLAALREQQGLKVDVVDVQDVYDEFSFGEKDPAAIHAFLALARTKWATPPRYVLLFGDGTYDPRGWLGGSPDLVPTKLVDTTFMETASDNWFADTNGGGGPDLALGRIPVGDTAQASAIVAKLVAYDGSSAPASVALGADQPDTYDFPAAVAQLAGDLPDGVGETSLVRPAGGNADLVAAIDSGPTVVGYLGHGNVDSWAGGWLTGGDASSLSNSGHPALFVSMTCLNGYFTDPYLPTLGESLLGAPGGAVAVWASTGLGDPASELAMSRALLGQLFDPQAPGGLAPVRLGDAVSAAQRASSSREAVVTAELLGDPTMLLR